MLGRARNHYETLGVSPEASLDEIRMSYKQLAKKFHPDKRHSELAKLANPQCYETNASVAASHGAADWDELFSNITRAYDVLFDPVKKAEYDFFSMKKEKKSMADSMNKLRELQRRDAELEEALLQIAFEKRRDVEVRKQGLVIIAATYGSTLAPNQLVDVTKQLQSIVEDSRLFLPANEPKYSCLPGVFDPCPEFQDKFLSVKYSFKGRDHFVIVSDKDKLIAPVKSHLATRNQPLNSQAEQEPNGSSEKQLVVVGSNAPVSPSELVVPRRHKHKLVRYLSAVGLICLYSSILWQVAGSAKQVSIATRVAWERAQCLVVKFLDAEQHVGILLS